MITGLGGATIWSEDIGNLLPFYRDVVGLRAGIETPDFVVFGDQSQPALAIGTHSEVRGRTQEPARHMAGLITDDIQADATRLKILDRELRDQDILLNGHHRTIVPLKLDLSRLDVIEDTPTDADSGPQARPSIRHSEVASCQGKEGKHVSGVDGG